MRQSASTPLPKHWPRRVRSAVIHAVSMANVAFTATQARTRLQATNDRPGAVVELCVERRGGRNHLPVISLRRVA